MVIVDPEPASLDSRVLTLFYTKDTQLGNLPIVVFHGPSTTTNSTLNTSRIQAHIFSVAGYQSFPRLTISPTSPLYAAVNHLPPEDQGDEITRGLAVSLLKYFGEIPEAVQEYVRTEYGSSEADDGPIVLFDASHAARLASQMTRVENSAQIIAHLHTALTAKSLTWTDLDVILPANSIRILRPRNSSDSADETVIANDGSCADYGKFQEIVELFGQPAFLPTSKIRRAPSRSNGSGRSRSLTSEQIQAIKHDLQEVLETEKSYISKLNELANGVAPEWTNSLSNPSTENQRILTQLFPPSLYQILELNTGFLDRLEQLLDHDANDSTVSDVTGTTAFVRLLLETLPTFRQPYIDYIKASNSFFSILNDFPRNPNTYFSQQLQQTGEQRLRSWLIEPVQRLPRYALLIESIIKKLPMNHPSISKLLKAKDLISEVLDAEQADEDIDAKTLRRLQKLVLNWPISLNPGRLITAADVVELKPPYAYNSRLRDESQGLMLLFPDHVLILRKSSGSTLSARGLVAEVDRPSIGSANEPQQPGLGLAYSFRLHETRFTESNDGHVICLNSIKKSAAQQHSIYAGDGASTTTQVYALVGSYEGKAARWNEEIARARIEYRFPEKLRESPRWGLRMINPEKTSLGLVSAIFEENLDISSNIRRQSNGRIRVTVQDGDISNAPRNESDDVEITVCVTLTSPSKYRLDFKGFNQNTSLDNVRAEDFMGVFLRRMSNIQRLHNQPTTTFIAQAFVSANQKIVETIRPELPIQAEMRSARFRPISPVKVLSNFLGGIRDQTSSSRMPTLERSNSKQSLRSIKDMRPGFNLGFSSAAEPSKTMAIAKATEISPEDSFAQLEKALNTYIVALHSRCGNVVGKVLRNRANADELSINELYNVLLEDPTQYQATAEVPVDVLFAAFEIFLNRAWRDKMGPLLPLSILARLDDILHTQSSSQMEKSFKALLQEMTPQNQRAFSALVKLLYDLLDASGNDGDRGAITVTFAEAMFQGLDYQRYIPLLDRLVDNIDILFDDVVLAPVDKPVVEATSMGRRTKATTPGSLSSTTSSFKKRFGFGTLSRENSKTDSESRVGQILRNLSKKATGESTSQPSSLSKSFMTRSKSIDNGDRRPFSSRPGSASAKETLMQSLSRPTSSHRETPDIVAPMASLGLNRSPATKKKRRSSLSDITSLQNNPALDFSGMVKPRALEMPADSIAPFQNARDPVRTPSPSRTTQHILASPSDSMSKIPSPAYNRKAASPSPTRKENIPPASPGDSGLSKPRMINHTGSLTSPKKRDLNATQIPSLRPGISSPSSASPQRNVLSPPAAGSYKRKPSGTPYRIVSGSPGRRVGSGSPQRKSSSQQRLRMQSPQKLRERLEREKKAVDQSSPALQAELTNISEGLMTNPTKEMQERLQALESRLASTLNDLARKNAAIQADVESSLLVSEKKAKSLDEVNRETNAENELLYDKFNSELIRVLDSVKTGVGLQEMKNKLKEAQDEASRLRKENQRLKRENLGLRSQLR